jgi:hypothetical protein
MTFFTVIAMLAIRKWKCMEKLFRVGQFFLSNLSYCKYLIPGYLIIGELFLYLLTNVDLVGFISDAC